MNIFELDGILGVGIFVITGCWLICCPLMQKEDKKKEEEDLDVIPPNLKKNNVNVNEMKSIQIPNVRIVLI